MESKKSSEVAIEVDHLCKDFKLYTDKPNTLKERLVRGRKNKINKIRVLDDIN